MLLCLFFQVADWDFTHCFYNPLEILNSNLFPYRNFFSSFTRALCFVIVGWFMWAALLELIVFM